MGDIVATSTCVAWFKLMQMGLFEDSSTFYGLGNSLWDKRIVTRFVDHTIQEQLINIEISGKLYPNISFTFSDIVITGLACYFLFFWSNKSFLCLIN